jgi:hypothetical protein
MTKITKQELNQMIKEEVRKQSSRRRLFESNDWDNIDTVIEPLLDNIRTEALKNLQLSHTISNSNSSEDAINTLMKIQENLATLESYISMVNNKIDDIKDTL